MSHGFELAPAKRPPVPDNPAVAGLSRLLDRFNHALLMLSMVRRLHAKAKELAR